MSSMIINLSKLFGMALLAQAFMHAPANAQDWPQRTVKFIIPFGPGSSSDTAASQIG